MRNFQQGVRSQKPEARRNNYLIHSRMEKTSKFQDLIAWQKAHALVLEIYSVTKAFPKKEVYNLTSQIRRAATSVAANIVEGYRKKGKADKVRFFNISEGSLDEVKYFLILSKDLEYIAVERYGKLMNLAEEVSRLLSSYSNTISRGTLSNSGS